MSGGIMVDKGCGQFVCNFVERLPTTDTGKPFVLHPWQRDAIMEFYSTLEPFDAGPPAIKGSPQSRPSGFAGRGGARERVELSPQAEAEQSGLCGDELVRKYQYLYLEIPKKNGKSELAAALGLYHLFGDGEMSAEVYLCAADKENAGIVFHAAVFMLETALWTAKMVAAGDLKIIRSRRRIEFYQRQRADNGRIDRVMVGALQVLSAEAYSKHGYKPSCVIFDELHSQPNRDLWDVMTFGAGSGRRQPVWIVLTTAGDDPDRNSIGWEVHKKAVAIRDARQLRTILAGGGDPRQVLSLRHTEAGDMEQAQAALLERDMPNWLPVLYGLTAMYGDDPDDLADIDIWDEALWYQCNPSLGTHLALRTLRLEAREAKRSEAGERLFRWLRLNQWIAVKAVGWLPLTLYDKTQIGPSKKAEREAWVREHLTGKTCYGGLDMSMTTDLTAFTLLFPPQEGLDAWVALFRAWRPKDTVPEAERRDHVPYRDWERAGFLTLCDGDMVDYRDVTAAVLAAAEAYDLQALGVDQHLTQTITPALQDAGILVMVIPQSMMGMSPAMKELEQLIRKREMLHVHNTCARWCFGNVRCAVDGNENIKPTKKRSTGRIDITVAWIISMATAMQRRNAGPNLDEILAREDFSM